MILYSVFVRGGHQDAVAAIDARLTVPYFLFQTVLEGTPLHPTTRVLIGPWAEHDQNQIHIDIVRWMSESRTNGPSVIGDLVFYSVLDGNHRGSYRMDEATTAALIEDAARTEARYLATLARECGA